MSENDHLSHDGNGVSFDEATQLVESATPHSETVAEEPLFHKASLHVYFAFFMTIFAIFHLYAPRAWLLEISLCRKYYESIDSTKVEHLTTWPWFSVPEDLCTKNVIQRHISGIRATNSFLEPLPALFLSIPYGILARQCGRRLIFCLGILGLSGSYVWFIIVCSRPSMFSDRAIWVSNAFLVIGAAPAYLIATGINLIVDVSSEQMRSVRIYYLLSIYQAASMVGAFTATFTMKVPWLPYFVALVSVVSAIITILWTSKVRSDALEISERQLSGHSFPQCLAIAMPSDRRIALVLFSFLLISIRLPMTMDMVLFYVSKRYDWSLRNASILLGFSRAFDLFLATLVIPSSVHKLQTSYKVSTTKIDLWISQASAACLALGAAIAGIAPSTITFIPGWIIFSAGFPIRMAIQAYATALVTEAEVVKLYSILSVIETIGDIVGDPLLWACWSWGLDIGSDALGLPWLLISFTFLVVTMIMWRL